MLLYIMRSSKGFTLLEIIIAIAVIAIFLILPILAYSSYLKKARDEKRKGDVTKISQALETYKAEKGTYPLNLQTLVDNGFLPDLPQDPLQNKDVTWSSAPNENYEYKFSSPDGTTYTLSAALETGGASEGGAIVLTVPTSLLLLMPPRERSLPFLN